MINKNFRFSVFLLVLLGSSSLLAGEKRSTWEGTGELLMLDKSGKRATYDYQIEVTMTFLDDGTVVRNVRSYKGDKTFYQDECKGTKWKKDNIFSFNCTEGEEELFCHKSQHCLSYSLAKDGKKAYVTSIDIDPKGGINLLRQELVNGEIVRTYKEILQKKNI